MERREFVRASGVVVAGAMAGVPLPAPCCRDITAIAVTSDDLIRIAQVRFTADEIYRVFGVPREVLYGEKPWPRRGEV